MKRLTETTDRRVLSRRGLLESAGIVSLGCMMAAPARAATAPAPSPLTPPQMARLVSIGGSVTEILYALGLADHVVAVDTTSLYPPEALAEKKSVGYMRALSPEGVLSVDPTAILLLEGAGPPPTVELLTRSSIPCVMVDGTPSAAAVSGRVRFLADLLGQQAGGQALAERIDAGFARLADLRAQTNRHPRVLFVLSMQNGHPLAAGTGTAADAVLGLAGAVNVAAGFSGYKPMSDEAIIAAAPDVILTMSRPGGTSPSDMLATPALQATEAGRHGRLIAMDGEALLGFGPRTPEVTAELIRLLDAATRA